MSERKKDIEGRAEACEHEDEPEPTLQRIVDINRFAGTKLVK